MDGTSRSVSDAHKRWKELEARVTKNRVEKCNKTLVKLLGDKADRMPRVGMAFSGGGWRAMASAVALMDALSIPLDASETAVGEEGIKIMDIITHIFGLSGGSWAAFVSLAGGDRNPFHHDPTDRWPISDDDRRKHPWLHGQDHKFDPAIHKYAGLKFITDAAHVSQACYRGGATTKLVSLSANVADTTFGTALSTKLLGATLVERWSNFLANDILSFKDFGELKAPSKEAQAEQNDATKNSNLKPNGSINTAEELTPEEVATAVSAANRIALKDPNIGSKARSIKLSDLRALIDRGDFPFVCNTAISDKTNPVARTATFNNATRLYDWVEISPYFIRNYASGNFTDDVDACGAYFDSPVATASTAAKEGDKAQSQESASVVLSTTSPRVRHEMRLHNFMAVCGSAFACDVGALLPKGMADTIRDNVKLNPSPIVGGGLTDIIYGKSADSPICTCRDAGIDFNVPFPPLLKEADREFDIVIAMDAGADSTNAYELQRAVELGYLVIDKDPSPLEFFPEGNRVRVFRSLKGGPTIMYFLGLTQRPTAKIIHKPEQIMSDAAKVRHAVMEELIPLLLSELRLFYSNAAAASGSLEAHVPNVNSLTRRIKYNPLSSRNEGIGAGDSLSLSSAEGNVEASPSTPYGGAAPATTGTYTSSVPAFGGSAYPAIGNMVRGKAGAFTSLAEAIIGAAASRGLLRDTIDAFFVVEGAVLNAIPQLERRVKIISVLEEEAVAIAANVPHAAPLKERLTLGGGADVVESLAQIGVIKKLSWMDVPNRAVELKAEWVDFYAATCLVRHVLPAAEIPFEVKLKVLKTIGREGLAETSSRAHIEGVLTRTKIFKTNSRMSTLLGSLISKLSKENCDLLTTNVVSNIVAKRYMSQIELVVEANEKVSEAVKKLNPTGYADSLEISTMSFCDNLVDFYTEMLSFEHLNPEMDLSNWDITVLASFVKTTRLIFDGLTREKHRTDLLSPIAHSFLLAEAIARHPTERSFLLLRVMCENKNKHEAFAMLPHMGAPSFTSNAGVSTVSDGIVRAAIADPALLPHRESILRVVAAAFDSPDGYKAKREAIQALVLSAADGLASVAVGPLKINLEVAQENCFASCIHILQKGGKLDNHDAVRAILTCDTHYATFNKSSNKQNALFAVWSEAAETQEFRVKIAHDCAASLNLFDFIAPFAPTIRVPAGTPVDKIEEVLLFAERHKQYVKKITADDLNTNWTVDQKARLERVNSALLSTAHEVKGAVIGKVGDVAGALKGGLKGFWGKK